MKKREISGWIIWEGLAGKGPPQGEAKLTPNATACAGGRRTACYCLNQGVLSAEYQVPRYVPSALSDLRKDLHSTFEESSAV